MPFSPVHHLNNILGRPEYVTIAALPKKLPVRVAYRHNIYRIKLKKSLSYYLDLIITG